MKIDDHIGSRGQGPGIEVQDQGLGVRGRESAVIFTLLLTEIKLAELSGGLYLLNRSMDNAFFLLLTPDPCNLYLYAQCTLDLGIQLIVVKPHQSRSFGRAHRRTCAAPFAQGRIHFSHKRFIVKGNGAKGADIDTAQTSGT